DESPGDGLAEPGLRRATQGSVRNGGQRFSWPPRRCPQSSRNCTDGPAIEWNVPARNSLLAHGSCVLNKIGNSKIFSKPQLPRTTSSKTKNPPEPAHPSRQIHSRTPRKLLRPRNFL